jgi:hypothetical protein
MSMIALVRDGVAPLLYVAPPTLPDGVTPAPAPAGYQYVTFIDPGGIGPLTWTAASGFARTAPVVPAALQAVTGVSDAAMTAPMISAALRAKGLIPS